MVNLSLALLVRFLIHNHLPITLAGHGATTAQQMSSRYGHTCLSLGGQPSLFHSKFRPIQSYSYFLYFFQKLVA